MAKSRRASRTGPAREAALSRQRTGASAPAVQGAHKPAAVGASRDRPDPAQGDPQEEGLDEWLAPDTEDDADLDQWLHDHGMDGDRDGPGR